MASGVARPVRAPGRRVAKIGPGARSLSPPGGTPPASTHRVVPVAAHALALARGFLARAGRAVPRAAGGTRHRLDAAFDVARHDVRCRMPEAAQVTGLEHGDRGAHRVDERWRRRGAAAV